MHKPKRSFRKVLAAGLAVTTALWSFSFLLVPVTTAAVEVHPAGTLVLSGGTVWKISDDGLSRRGFDTPERFWSSRYSFDQVVPANSADLALPDGGLAPWGSGVLFNDSGTIFMVAGGVKRGFSSAAAFTGQGFKFSDAVAGDVSSLSAGANIDSATQAHPEGTFVLDNGTVWYITATGRKGLSQPGVLFSHGGSFETLVQANAADLALANEGLMNFRTGTLVNDNGTIWAVQGNVKRGFPSASCYTGFGFSFSSPIAGSVASYAQGDDFCPSGDSTPPVSSTGTLTVSLAGDTPASATVVKNAARVPFTKVNLTATGGDVTVDTLEIERVGVSTDTNFSDIILLDVTGTTVGVASQIGNEKTLGSTHKATFNDDIVVKNGTTKSIMVAANMAATLNAADQAALRVNSVTMSGTASVVGSLPITGNTMTMNNSVAIAAVTVQLNANPSATTQNVGTNDYMVTSFQIQNGSQEKVEVHSIKYTQNGSAGDSDLKDLEVVIDGAVVGSVSAPSNKKVQINFASPIVLDKGNTKNVDLRLDIAGGSGRNISLDIDQKADVVIKGQTFGYYVLPTFKNSSGTTISTSPFINPSDTEIDKGSITFSKGVLASLNVSEGSTGQALGAFKATVQGEPIQVTRFVMGVTVSGTGNAQDVTNLVVKDANGTIVGGPVDPDSTVAARDTATTTDTIIFPTGTNTYTIYGDLNTDFAANDTVAIDMPDPDGLVTAKGTVTNQTVTASPTTDLSLDTVTVKAGSLSVSTSASPAAQSVIVGQSGFTFANIVFDASNSGEDVRLNQVAVVHKTSANSIQTNIANLQLYNGATALTPIVQPSAVAAVTATSTFSLTSPITIPKGSSVTLTLKGDMVAGSADQTHQFGCNGTACVTAVGVTTGNSVTANVTNSDGQLMTIATSGSLTVAADSSTPQQDFLIVGGSSKVTVGELLLTALNEDVDLSDIHFTATAVNGGALNDEFSKIYLFDGATQIASVTPTTTTAVTFTNLEGKLLISKGSSGKKLTVKVDAFDVTNNQGDGKVADSGDGVSLAVAEDAYGAKGVSSGSALAAGSKSGNFTGKQVTVHKTVPTYAKQALSSNTLVNSSGVALYKFKLTADSKGDVGFYKATFAITTSTATVTAFQLFEEPGTASEVNLTNNGTRGVSSVLTASSGGTGGEYSIDILFDTGTDGVGSGGEFRFIPAGTSKTYELRGTVASSVSGSTVSVVQRGDDSRNGTYPEQASDVDGDEQDQFIWSDLHYGNSSSSATITSQWVNGYKVPGLSSTTTSEVLSR